VNERDDRPDDWRTSRYDRDRRGRDYDERDDYDDAPGYRKDPRQTVRAPGLTMAICGWLGVAASVLAMGWSVIVALEVPGPQPPDDVIMAVVVGVCGLIALAGSVVSAIGGQRMMQCRNYGLAMTAAVLNIASIVVFGLCGVLMIGVGIWALVVLSQSDVKREFDRVRRAATRPVQDDYEDRR
jgi:hypothetical protein